MKATYQSDREATTSSQPWKPWLTCMVQKSILSFSYLRGYFFHLATWNNHFSYLSRSSLQPYQLHHENPPCLIQFPAQSIPHLHNNKSLQHAYNVELQNLPSLPTHFILPIPLLENYVRFGKVLNLKIAKFMEDNGVSSNESTRRWD